MPKKSSTPPSLLTKVVGRAVIFNLKKSLQKIFFKKSCWWSRHFQQKKVITKDLLKKVVGRAVMFNITMGAPLDASLAILSPSRPGPAATLSGRLKFAPTSRRWPVKRLRSASARLGPSSSPPRSTESASSCDWRTGGRWTRLHLPPAAPQPSPFSITRQCDSKILLF